MIETGGIRLDFSGTSGFLSRDELLAYAPRVKVAAAELAEGTSPGSEFLGWLDLPDRIRVYKTRDRLCIRKETLPLRQLGRMHKQSTRIHPKA